MRGELVTKKTKKNKPKPRERVRKPVLLVPIAARPVPPTPEDVDDLRNHIRGLVCEAATGMVSTTIERVNDGQFQAMKYLFEMIGLFPAPMATEEPQQDSLAEMLLSRLGIRDDATAEGAAANHVK